MSDDFIPLNQSTPVQRRWNGKNQGNQSGYQNNWQQGNHRRRGHDQHNRWGNNSQHTMSFGSDCNSSYGRDNKSNIDAYLHPSMLKDPWEHLRQQQQQQ